MVHLALLHQLGFSRTIVFDDLRGARDFFESLMADSYQQEGLKQRCRGRPITERATPTACSLPCRCIARVTIR